jgi:hypothetical protein
LVDVDRPSSNMSKLPHSKTGFVESGASEITPRTSVDVVAGIVLFESGMSSPIVPNSLGSGSKSPLHASHFGLTKCQESFVHGKPLCCKLRPRWSLDRLSGQAQPGFCDYTIKMINCL